MSVVIKRAKLVLCLGPWYCFSSKFGQHLKKYYIFPLYRAKLIGNVLQKHLTSLSSGATKYLVPMLQKNPLCVYIATY
jgi:hypothetical protein